MKLFVILLFLISSCANGMGSKRKYSEYVIPKFADGIWHFSSKKGVMAINICHEFNKKNECKEKEVRERDLMKDGNQAAFNAADFIAIRRSRYIELVTGK